MSQATVEFPSAAAQAADFPVDDFAPTAIEELPIGQRAQHEMRAPVNGSVVREAGETVTAALVAELREREFQSVLVHLADRAAWQESQTANKKLQLDAMEVDSAPDSVRSFVERITSQAPPVVDCERRKQNRYRVVQPILVVPVNGKNEPIGHPFQAITRDLSSGGVSFIHTRSAKAERMIVELASNGERKQLAMEVLRCRPWNHLYEIAGKWVARLE